MIISRSVAALGLALSLTACDSSAGVRQVDAEASFAAQNYFAARDAAQKMLRDDPEDTKALEILARTQIAMGQGSEALRALDRLANLRASPADETLLRAEARLQVGNAGQALSSALAGLGRTTMPLPLVAEALAQGRLVALDGPEDCRFSYWLLAPRPQWRQKKVKALLAHLTGE